MASWPIQSYCVPVCRTLPTCNEAHRPLIFFDKPWWRRMGAPLSPNAHNRGPRNPIVLEPPPHCMQMTIDKYVSFRLGPGPLVRMAWNMLWRSFTAPTLSAFWRYWNPGYGFFLLKYCYGPLRKHVPHAVALILTFAFCGFFAHDCLVIIPAALMGSKSILFPFVTCWFLLISLIILATDRLGVSLKSLPRLLRVPVHVSVLVATFYLIVSLKNLV